MFFEVLLRLLGCEAQAPWEGLLSSVTSTFVTAQMKVAAPDPAHSGQPGAGRAGQASE